MHRRFLLFALLVLVAGVVAAQRGPSSGGVLPSQIWTAPPDTPIPDGIGRIAGRVLDRDSLVPVANARVNIGYIGPVSTQNALRRPIASRVITSGADGAFMASGLALGDYAVVATIQGYTRARRLGSTIDQGVAVVLSAVRPDAAATLRLARVASVAGTVTDAAGVPLAGAALRIYHLVFSPQLVWQPLPVNAFSDQSGRYRFTNAPPGEYIVGVYYRSVSMSASVMDALFRASDPTEGERLRTRFADSEAFFLRSPLLPVSGAGTDTDGYRWAKRDAAEVTLRPGAPATTGNATTFFPDAPSIESAEVISLEGGEDRTDVNIRVRRTPGVRVSGALVGTPEQVAHVGVRLMPVGSEDVLQTFPGEVAAAITDAQGRFSFFAVPPGPFILDTVITTAEPTRAPLPPRRVPTYVGRKPVDVSTTDISDLRVPVRGLLHIRGRFEYQPNPDIPPNTMPPPVNLALLTIGTTRASAALVPTVVASEVASTFAFENLIPGRYTINTPMTGNWVVKTMTIAGKDVLRRAFDLTDADIDDVVITMTTSGINRLNGYVQASDGGSLEGAQVVVFPADYRGWVQAGRPGVTRSAFSGARGVYAATGLPDGDYLVVAFTGDVERDWMSLTALGMIAPLAQRVHLDGGKAVMLDVRSVLAEIPVRTRK